MSSQLTIRRCSWHPDRLATRANWVGDSSSLYVTSIYVHHSVIIIVYCTIGSQYKTYIQSTKHKNQNMKHRQDALTASVCVLSVNVDVLPSLWIHVRRVHELIINHSISSLLIQKFLGQTMRKCCCVNCSQYVLALSCKRVAVRRRGLRVVMVSWKKIKLP